MLVDRWSGGDPNRAGGAYATNVVGSIAGPLVAGFWLLPLVGEHTSIALLTVPLFLIGAIGVLRPALIGVDPLPRRVRVAIVPALAVLALALVTTTRSFETLFPDRVIRRDHTATVVASGTGMDRDLRINGIRTTRLTPVTKWMAHLPLAFLDRPPADALTICFGMGTTFRSLLSWDVNATAVELVPSVPALFPYYHADAAALAASPKARIVVDDGRRFLERSRESYDVIVVDPPDPPEAAGSSQLYSREFYAIVRARLRPGGILHQWIPTTDVATVASVTKAVGESFSQVRAFPVVNRRPELEVIGVHFLASDRTIPRFTPRELAQRMPPAAVRDLLEWPFGNTAEQVFSVLLGYETPIDALIALARWAPTLADDRPFNEYFFLRRWLLM